MLMRRGKCVTVTRRMSNSGEECVLLRRGECVTEDNRVLY